MCPPTLLGAYKIAQNSAKMHHSTSFLNQKSENFVGESTAPMQAPFSGKWVSLAHTSSLKQWRGEGGKRGPPLKFCTKMQYFWAKLRKNSVLQSSEFGRYVYF